MDQFNHVMWLYWFPTVTLHLKTVLVVQVALQASQETL